MTESRALVGIDGGGSAVRVVVTTPDLTLLGQAEEARSIPVQSGGLPPP